MAFPRAGLLTLPFVLVVGVGTVTVLFRVLTAQGDVTKRLGLPAPADEFLQRDEVAYPVHATLGAFLNRLGGSPEAAGVQWLKAAAHATTDAQLERAVHGIGEAAAQDGDGARVRAAVCQRLRSILDRRPPQAPATRPVARPSPCVPN